MRSDVVVHCVDAHTAGEPTRVVVGGLPPIPGESMPAKRQFLARHFDWLRRGLLHEPRGHADMFGAVILPPSRPEATLGVVFMDSGGYLSMCGHGTIGVVTVAVETGMVPAQEPCVDLVLDTPAGLVATKVAIADGRVREVTFRNVPAFLYARDVSVTVPEWSAISLDIAFGGNFFALVPAVRLGFRLDFTCLRELISAGLAVREAVNAAVAVCHPTEPAIAQVDLVEFYGPAASGEAHLRNVVVFGAGSVDRSPCGTGTCAKMAAMHARGELAIGEEFRHESILGTIFRGRLVGRTLVGDYEAVVPEITGSAYLTGFHQFVFDPYDPLRDGFLLV